MAMVPGPNPLKMPGPNPLEAFLSSGLCLLQIWHRSEETHWQAGGVQRGTGK